MSDLTRMLVESDPRGAIDLTLGWLIGRHRAQRGCMLRVHDGRLEPVANRGGADGNGGTGPAVDLERLDDVRALWTTHVASLATGRPLEDGTVALFPVREGGQIAGLIFLDRPQDPLDVKTCVGLNDALAWALSQAPKQGTVVAFMDREAAERERLLESLAGHGWCVSDVARDLRVTRRTIYQRMERWDIKRPPPGKR